MTAKKTLALKTKPSWECPRCGRVFAVANTPHDCVVSTPIDRYFAGKPPEWCAAFEAVLAAARKDGKVTPVVVKNRIELHAFERFAYVEAKRKRFYCHILLDQSYELGTSVTKYGKFYDHFFAMDGPRDVDLNRALLLRRAHNLDCLKHGARPE